MIYMQGNHFEGGKIIKDLMFQWRLFVIHKLMISCMIGFYVNKSLLLYNGCLETVHINNQTILQFVYIWSK